MLKEGWCFSNVLNIWVTPKHISVIYKCLGSLPPWFQQHGCHLLAADPLLCVWLVKKSSRPEHANTVQHSSPSPPTRLAWVEKTVCVCICVCWGWVGLQPLPLPIPAPFPQRSSSLSLCLSLSPPSLLSVSLSRSLSAGTGNPQQREQHQHREREREREREAGWSRAGCHASEPSVNLPPLPPDRVLAAGQGLACKPASHISP